LYAYGFLLPLQVLHAQHLVLGLVVDQLIDQGFCHQETQPAGSQAFFLPRGHVLDGIVVEIVDRRVSQAFKLEAGAGIGDAVHPSRGINPAARNAGSGARWRPLQRVDNRSGAA
jgi:hypothetical protein